MTSLGPLDLAAASAAMLGGAALSLALSLGVHRSILIAAARMVVQLLLVGVLLRWVFAQGSPWITALIVLVMLLAAAHQVGARHDRRLEGGWHILIGGVPTTLTTTGVVLLALLTTLRPVPWYDPRQAIPLTGIVLGTAMNAASVALHHLFDAVARERGAIEARLALGSDRTAAFHDLVRSATRAGLLPSLNQMAAAGVVTMPGIMTGQLLAGMDPSTAAKYQIVLMFLLAGASFFAAFGAVRLAVLRLTDDRHRLRLDRMRATAVSR